MVLDRRLLQNNAAANSLLTPQDRIFSEYDINVSIGVADAAVAYAIGYPFGFNKSTGKHGPWTAPDPSVLVVDMGVTTPATGGTWGITVNDQVIANTTFAYNVTAAVVAAAIKAIGYDATVVLAGDAYTITFDGTPEIETLPTLAGDVTQLTGATGEVATATAGTATNGTQVIKGFVNPNVVQSGIKTDSVALVVLTGTDTLCTATSINPHGLVSGMSLVHSGAGEAKLNITATITVLNATSYTYAVAAVSGGVVDSGAYTTTNEVMAIIMSKGVIHASLPESLVAVGDVTALQTAMKDGLVAAGIIVQGLVGRN